MTCSNPAFIEDLVSSRFRDPKMVASLRNEYSRNGVLIIREFFDPDIFAELRHDVAQLLQHARRKDFTMGTYHTPRKISVVGGRTIFTHSQKLAALYASFPIVRLFSNIVGADLFLSRQADAFMTINHLERLGDTQGWHLDDGAPVMVYAFSSPEPGCGGVLEFIPNWHNVTQDRLDLPLDKTVKLAAHEGRVSSIHLEPNSMYLLKSDTALHRVTPLRASSTPRTVIAAGYESVPVQCYTHTGSDLYGGA